MLQPVKLRVLNVLLESLMLALSPFFSDHKKVAKERVSETQKGSDFSVRSGYGVSRLKDFPRAALNLLKNPTYMLLNIVSVTEWFMLASIAVFGPKYLESMFNMTTGNAALVAGRYHSCLDLLY